MSEDGTLRTGGCLCGQVRYEARGEPIYAGHCYCADCRKASGSGFIPFMGFPADAMRFSGETRMSRWPVASGREAVRNFCPECGGLVFGGEVGLDQQHTVYAGSLDNPSSFSPAIAIFTDGRPDWAVIPAHLKVFGRGPRDG